VENFGGDLELKRLDLTWSGQGQVDLTAATPRFNAVSHLEVLYVYISAKYRRLSGYVASKKTGTEYRNAEVVICRSIRTVVDDSTENDEQQLIGLLVHRYCAFVKQKTHLVLAGQYQRLCGKCYNCQYCD